MILRLLVHKAFQEDPSTSYYSRECRISAPPPPRLLNFQIPPLLFQPPTPRINSSKNMLKQLCVYVYLEPPIWGLGKYNFQAMMLSRDFLLIAALLWREAILQERNLFTFLKKNFTNMIAADAPFKRFSNTDVIHRFLLVSYYPFFKTFYFDVIHRFFLVNFCYTFFLLYRLGL